MFLVWCLFLCFWIAPAFLGGLIQLVLVCRLLLILCFWYKDDLLFSPMQNMNSAQQALSLIPHFLLFCMFNFSIDSFPLTFKIVIHLGLRSLFLDMLVYLNILSEILLLIQHISWSSYLDIASIE